MSLKSLKKFEIARYSKYFVAIYYHLLKFPRFIYFIRKYLGTPLLLRRETWLNRLLRFGFLLTGGGTIGVKDLKASRYLMRDLQKYFGFLNSESGEKPLVWTEWNLSSEILKAFNAATYVPETFAVMGHMMGTDFTVKLIQEAENAGLPPEYCSASKTAIGGYMLNQAPEPDIIISSSHPCDSVDSVYQSLQYMTGKPMFVVDTPYWDDDDSYKYYEDNTWALIDFLEKNLNQKLDWDKLKQACENINKTNYYLQELSEMSRAIPSPSSMLPLLLAYLGRLTSYGSSDNLLFTKGLYENAKERLKAGKGVLKKEKIRIIWWDVPMVFGILYPWLQREFGAVTVADFIGRTLYNQIDTSSRESMIRDMSKNQLFISMARQMRGPSEFFTEEFEKIIDEYSGDCFVFVRHQGCKGGWAIFNLIRDICKKAGLPALYLSTDIFDKRCMSEEQIKQEFRDFFRSNGLA